MDTKPAVSQTEPTNHKRRNFWIIIVTAIFIALFIGYGIYWFLIARFQVYTDDAYVSGIQAPVITQTTGNVTQVNYANTDLVKAGDVLVVLDKSNAQLLYAQAQDELVNTVRQTQVLYIDSKEDLATIKTNQIQLSQAQKDYDRRVVLGRKDDISIEALQHAKDSVELAQLQLEIAEQQYNANQALLHNVTLSDHPAVKQAADKLRQAWLALQRTEIRSPITGYVARQNVQVGSQVSPNSPLMVIVPIEPV